MFGKALPIVGTEMGTQFDVFRQMKEKVVDNLDDLTEFNATLIEQALRDALGGTAELGLGWLVGDVTKLSETEQELVFQLMLDRNHRRDPDRRCGPGFGAAVVLQPLGVGWQ